MPRLKVILRGSAISDIELNPNKEYIAGRKENSDILLQPEKGISREHFKLKFEDGQWKLSSLSRFGEVFSLGQRVETITLEHAQTFQVPPYEFQYSEYGDVAFSGANESAPVVNESDRTVIGAVQQVPYIKMMSSSGDVREMLRLEIGDAWIAGRDPACQIVIPDQRVSRRQFELRKINGVFTVIDLGSVNGTFLNGVPVSSTDPQSLKSGDAISVLDNMMYFELHDPNFQYRMEKVEVPPLQFEQYAADEPAGFPQQHIPEIEQPGYQNQFQAQQFGAGPFTGMPQQNSSENNQFYQFQAPPPEVRLTAWQKFSQNRPMVIVVAMVIVFAAFFASQYMDDTGSSKSKPKNSVASKEGDAFDKLTVEEKEKVKSLYSFVEKAIKQQQYSLARENINQLHQLLPNGYKDSKAYEVEAINGEQTFIQQQQAEVLEKERQEQEAKLKKGIQDCEKILNADITVDKMKECLSPVALIDPTNNDYVRLLTQAEKIESDRKLKLDQEAMIREQSESLKKMFDDAEVIRKQGYAKKAMKAYEVIAKSPLPDPKNLKALAKSRMRFISKKVDERSKNNLIIAESLIKDGHLKDGISALMISLKLDPDNPELQEKIEQYTSDLRNQVRVIYQESVIDENFGNIEGSESRQGAKDKWRKIIEMDLEDGDYYRKAFVKLKKYGAL